MSFDSDSSSSSDSSGCPSRVYHGDNDKNRSEGNRQRHRPPWQPQNVAVQSFCPSPPRIPQIPHEIEFYVYSRIEQKPPSSADASATSINETPVICFRSGGQINTSSNDDMFILDSVESEPPPSTSTGTCRPSSPQRSMVMHSPKKRPPSLSLSRHCPQNERQKCTGDHKITRGQSQRSQRLFCVGFVGGEELSNGRSIDMLSLIIGIDAAMKRIQCQNENTAVLCCSTTSELVCRAAFCWAQRNQRPAFLVAPPVGQNDVIGSEDMPFGVLRIECAEGNEIREYMGLVDAAIQVGDGITSRSQLDVFREQKPDGRIIGVDT